MLVIRKQQRIEIERQILIKCLKRTNELAINMVTQ
jgi:hypothetical protein